MSKQLDPTRPRYRERQYPCLGCARLIAPSRAIYLHSISHKRNVGPFHAKCAARLSVEDEDRLWENQDILLSAAHTFGPTHEKELVRTPPAIYPFGPDTTMA